MQQGGSPFGTPPPPPLDMSHFSTSTPPPPAQPQVVAAAAEPISSRPPQQPSPSAAGPNYDELGSAEDPLGEEGPAGGGLSGGNRWPRQETLALLKIRSDMDAAFRDATLKSPLWEEVSRKLGELGYKRGAKKCKEKFENVHKYYKRTKEGRAGRQDGKSYRFFSQLEALQNTTRGSSVISPSSPSSVSVMMTAVANPIASVPNHSPRLQPPPPPPPPPPQQISAPMPIATAPPPTMQHPNVAGISFSSNTSSEAASEEDDETTEERGGRKRKRRGSAGGDGGRKMMDFFEGLMRQVTERQEAMQQRFLEAIERSEHQRTIREEAWRRQETARLAREYEIAAAERAAASARGAAVMSFLQKFTGQTVTALPPPTILTAPALTATAPPATISIAPTPTLPQPQPAPPPRPNSSELIPFEPQEAVGPAGVSPDPTSSRWPKSEVHALIKLRSGLDSRYQLSGAKGPLWEEISSGMKRIGYNRSSKRCKEKWENINKYFKKVKESNKNRPEDAKTCPYFHQLDALYRSKLYVGSGENTTVPALPERPHEHENISIMPPPPPPQQQQQQPHQKDSGGRVSINGRTHSMLKKPEDIVMDQSNTNEYGRVDEPDSDNMDDDEDDDDEDDGKTQYRIQFQRQNVSSGNGNGNGNGASVAPGGGGKTAAGSFLAMVR